MLFILQRSLSANMNRRSFRKRSSRISHFSGVKSIALKLFALLLLIFIALLVSPKMDDVLTSLSESLEIDDYFNLTTINISNNTKVTNEEIYMKLGEYLGKNILLIDLLEVKDKVKELHWIKSITVERDLPDAINIYVEEELPEALYFSNNEYHLLSRTGKILDKATDSEVASYIKIEGKDANLYFMPIVTLINGFSELQNNIEQLTYVKDRRWNVKLKNGLIILLPHEKEKFALEIFLDRMPSLLQKSSLYVVDLRLIPDKIFIRAQ